MTGFNMHKTWALNVMALMFVIALVALGFWVKKHLPPLWQLKIGLQMKGDVYVDSEGNRLPYRLFLPKGKEDGLKKPLVLILQSAFGRGDDNFTQMSTTVESFISEGFQGLQRSYVLAPQCPKGMQWNESPESAPPYVNYSMSSMGTSWRQNAIVALIKDLASEYSVDLSRIYITGISMGGTGTWDTLYRFPDFFAAAVPLNGRSDPSVAEAFASTPIWMFHGSEDRVAPIENSIEMHEALRRGGSSATLTTLDAGHDISRQSYTKELFEWLVQQKRE